MSTSKIVYPNIPGEVASIEEMMKDWDATEKEVWQTLAATLAEKRFDDEFRKLPFWVRMRSVLQDFAQEYAERAYRLTLTFSGLPVPYPSMATESLRAYAQEFANKMEDSIASEVRTAWLTALLKTDLEIRGKKFPRGARKETPRAGIVRRLIVWPLRGPLPQEQKPEA